MVAPEALEKFLQNPLAKILAGLGFLLVVNGVVNSTVFHLADLVGLWERGLFQSVWRLSWVSILAMFITVGLWVVQSTVRKYDASMWLISVGAFVGWVLFVVPVATYLPEFLETLVALTGNGIRVVGILVALVALDRAIPRMQAGVASPVSMAQGGPSAQPQATATQAAGWYPDPQGQADWRWWDGADWTENTN